MQQRVKKIERINKQAAMKAEKNATLGEQLPDMQVTVAELRHICEAAGSKNSHFSSKYTPCEGSYLPLLADNAALLVSSY